MSPSSNMEHSQDCVVPIEDIVAVIKLKAPVLPRPTYNPRDHQCRGPYLSGSSSSSSSTRTLSSTRTQSRQSSRTSVSSRASSRTLVHTLSNTSTFSHSSNTTLNRSLSIVTNSSLSTQSTSRQWPSSTERLVQDQQAEAKADDDAKSTANEKFTKFKEAFGNFFMVVAFLLGALLIFMAIVISSNPEMFESIHGNRNVQE